MSRPLVSIVTPTLNQGRFIEQTIRSIRAQSYDHYQHIVIDGGSTDETLDILRRYEGTYPMRWISEPDEGMYDAINKGMRQANGDILAYLNSDDLYFPWTLEVVVEAFDREPDADLVFGDALGVFDDTGQQDVRFQPPFRYESLLRGGFLVQPAVFWRREVQSATGEFDPEFKLAGDLDWWLRAGPHRRYLRVDELLAIERDHSDAKRLSQWDKLLAESVVMRARIDHAPVMRKRAGVALERFRAWWSRRVLWGRFLRAARATGSIDRGWGNFIAASHPQVPLARGLVAQLPWVGVRLSGGSIRSGVNWLESSTPDGPVPLISDRP